MEDRLGLIIKIVLFLVFCVMVIFGQRQSSYGNLAMMLVGLAGLIGLLYLYNRKYR